MRRAAWVNGFEPSRSSPPMPTNWWQKSTVSPLYSAMTDMSASDLVHALVPNVARRRLGWLDFVDPALKQRLTEQSGRIDFVSEALAQERQRETCAVSGVIIPVTAPSAVLPRNSASPLPVAKRPQRSEIDGHSCSPACVVLRFSTGWRAISQNMRQSGFRQCGAEPQRNAYRRLSTARSPPQCCR
jgi:hypothetical protein